jgi:choline dehydrogenase-like flavoprotein
MAGSSFDVIVIGSGAGGGTLVHRLAPSGKRILLLGGHQGLFARNLYLKERIPLAGVAHQNGTIRFGDDPCTSALDRNCRAHELDNLYVVDASFFPSSGAVNPALTIMANALRVGDHLMDRLNHATRMSA